MPRIAFIDKLADRRNAHKAKRQRKRDLKAKGRHEKRVVMGKVVGCVAVLALFFLLGLLVGNDEYHMTLIGWVPFIMSVTGIILAWLYLFVLRRTVSFEERMDVSECERDSDVPFHITFKNHSPLLVTRMKATFYIADMFDNIAHEATTTMGLAPFEETELSFAARFEHIGSYRAGIDSIVLSDFLGLFTYTMRNVSRQVVMVTPKYVELDGIQFSNEAMDETTKAAKSVLADSMEYAYVREYEQGDPLKTIHWKLSARANNYMTRLFEVYTNPSVVIVMDFYAPADEARDLMTMFDAVVESAFSLSRYSTRQGMDVELHFRNRYGDEQVLSTVHREKVASVVADMPRMSNEPDDAAAALDILEKLTSAARGFNNIFVCSANVGADMVSAVVEAKLRRRSPTMVAVVPPSLVGREREDHCANLGRLESVDIPYSIIAKASELAVMGGR